MCPLTHAVQSVKGSPQRRTARRLTREPSKKPTRKPVTEPSSLQGSFAEVRGGVLFPLAPTFTLHLGPKCGLSASAKASCLFTRGICVVVATAVGGCGSCDAGAIAAVGSHCSTPFAPLCPRLSVLDLTLADGCGRFGLGGRGARTFLRGRPARAWLARPCQPERPLSANGRTSGLKDHGMVPLGP